MGRRFDGRQWQSESGREGLLRERKPIRVTIIDNSSVSKCEGRCGLDLSAPERIQSIADLLRKRYGESVHLDYYDLGDSSAEGSHLPLPEEIMDGTSSLPILLVNGKLRISGYFDLRLMHEVIQAEIEMVSESGQ